jgi:hypothetical protein
LPDQEILESCDARNFARILKKNHFENDNLEF